MFKIGDTVIYVSGVYADSKNNPLWGGKHGKTPGTVDYVESGSIGVAWSNGTHNTYKQDDLAYHQPLQEELPKELTLYVRIRDLKSLYGYSYITINSALEIYEEYIVKARSLRKKKKVVPFEIWLTEYKPTAPAKRKFRLWGADARR